MEMTRRAYSCIEVKAVNEERRIIRGVATSPAVDRVGDIVDPMGVKFQNPLPLLWQHKHDKPIGTVKFDAPTEKASTSRLSCRLCQKLERFEIGSKRHGRASS